MATTVACDPELCPCTDGACTLSMVTRAVRGHVTAVPTHEQPTDEPGGPMAGQRTLRETESAVAERLSRMDIDLPAMAAVSNLYRAAGAVRNHMERTVLAPHDLTWTGWVVLWVVWIWGEVEARHVAAEAGISKGTLTGVARTLEARRLLRRTQHPDDARRVLLSLTPAGQRLMTELFPAFNAQESAVTAPLSQAETRTMGVALRKVVMGLEEEPADGPRRARRTS